MILVDAKRAAFAIGSACKRYDGSDDQKLLELLRLITPRVEDALEVKSLLRGTYTDTYLSPSDWKGSRSLSVLTSNAFLTGSVSFAGVEFYPDDVGGAKSIINKELGIIRAFPMAFPNPTFTVTYTSGFDIPPDPVGPPTDTSVHADAMYRAGIDVPDWIVAIATTVLVNNYRVKIASPIIPKDIGLRALSEAIAKEIKALVYKRYMRPRYGMLSPVSYEKV